MSKNKKYDYMEKLINSVPLIIGIAILSTLPILALTNSTLPLGPYPAFALAGVGTFILFQLLQAQLRPSKPIKGYIANLNPNSIRIQKKKQAETKAPLSEAKANELEKAYANDPTKTQNKKQPLNVIKKDQHIRTS